jgi:hypothetical protein
MALVRAFSAALLDLVADHGGSSVGLGNPPLVIPPYTGDVSWFTVDRVVVSAQAWSLESSLGSVSYPLSSSSVQSD